jgi:hypothetical protein
MAEQLQVRQTKHWCRLNFHLVSEILALGRHAEDRKGMICFSRVSVRPAFCRNAIDGTKTRRRRICISMRLRPFGWLPRRGTDNTETLPILFNFRLLHVQIAVWPIESLLAAIVPRNVEKMSGPWSSWFVHLIRKYHISWHRLLVLIVALNVQLYSWHTANILLQRPSLLKLPHPHCQRYIVKFLPTVLSSCYSFHPATIGTSERARTD